MTLRDAGALRWAGLRQGCARKTFTEWVAQVPPRCRVTRRLREQAAAGVTQRGSRRPRRPDMRGVLARSRTRRSDPVLMQAPAPVVHLGIDEHRRGLAGGAPACRPGRTSCWRTGGTRQPGHRHTRRQKSQRKPVLADCR